MATIHTTYQPRGYLTRQGYGQLDDVLRQCAVLCNAALQEWRDSYSQHVGYVHAVVKKDDFSNKAAANLS